MAKRIPLSQGKYTIVDDEDYEWLSRWNWSLRSNYNSDRDYAVRALGVGHDRIWVLMHRLVIGCPANRDVDHINGDGLDNRKSNLRVATRAQNLANRRSSRGSSSQHVGVSWDKGMSKWRAYYGEGESVYVLGHFEDERMAARVRDKKALIERGEFARLNFPDELMTDKEFEQAILECGTKRRKRRAKRA